MKAIVRFRLVFAVFFCAGEILSPVKSALATLGETSDSIETDRKAFALSRHTQVTHESYTVHEISDDGMTLREYVSTGGLVFGLAWKGVTHPDLSPLLGSYNADYKAASMRSQTPRARSATGHKVSSQIKGSSVVVEKSGHMRALQGKAYVPALLPEGVTADEIQ
jgi:hypothetical protein